MKATKTPDAKKREAEMIQDQLDHLGFPAETLTPIRKALSDFVDQGWGSTQTHRMPDLGVKVTLLLSTQPHVVSYARVSKL